jgi:hypothetical protein
MKTFLIAFLLVLTSAGCISGPIQNKDRVSNSATSEPAASGTSTPAEATARTPKPALTDAPTIPIETLNAQAVLEVLEGACDEYQSDSSRDSRFSPDGEWLATNCGYKRNQTLIVQNREGAKWVFHFAAFLSSGLEGMPGSFGVLAWSSDGRFLYFTKFLGYSGGGNQCFPGLGAYGLYRLHLGTGVLTTLIPSRDDRFPGNEIRFSPTNNHYAIDLDGVTITNLISGQVSRIEKPGVMEMSWSPDGRFLVFSTAACDETFVESSSIFAWDTSGARTQLLFSTEEMVLRPQSWTDNSTLRFEGETWIGNHDQYAIFEYDLADDVLMSIGTATPSP